MQLNHPWADAEFGRDLGYPRALALNALKNLPATDDGTNAGMYVRSPKGGFANNGQHAQEVMNGTQNDMLLPYRAFWFYGLSQGQLVTGTANSDSHSLTDNTVGLPRNIVYADTRPGPGFDTARFNAALKAGASFGTNGPVIEATVDTATRAPALRAHLARALGGREAAPQGLRRPLGARGGGAHHRQRHRREDAGRLGALAPGGPVRRRGTRALRRARSPSPSWSPAPATRGSWWRPGRRLPLAADFGGPGADAPDGIPDTGDNNGDGVVDRDDIAKDSTYGPLKTPAPPSSEADPLFHFAQVVTGGYPMAFTNPFLLDRNGNGHFDAPGVAAP